VVAQLADSTNAPSSRGVWPAVRGAASDWLAHKDAKAGAALAYYSIFSIGPLIVIVISVAGLIFGREAIQAEVMGALKGLVGDNGAKAIDTMLAGANKKGEGLIATAIGAGTLVYAAIGVVVQLKDALNAVWEVKETPGRGLAFRPHLCPVIRCSAGWRLPVLGVHAADRRTGRDRQICRQLSAGERCSDRRLYCIVHRDKRAVRSNVQVAA